MEYRYSELVDPSVYETHSLGGGIPLRTHKDPQKEIDGTLRAQKDWVRYVHPLVGYKGGLGDSLSFVSATVPECLPERLEIISYANEFAFLYDGEFQPDRSMISKRSLVKGSTAKDKQDMHGRDQLVDSFSKGAANPHLDSVAGNADKLQAQVIKEMMAIDSDRAITTMKAWVKFLQLASRSRSQPQHTLEEYLPGRIIDAGELIWYGTLTFGMALTIPDDELELCMELARPGYAAISLTNDLYSWNKEQEEAKRSGLDYVYNAIWVIMKERSINEEEAKAVCAAEIRDYIEQYCQIVEEVQGCDWLSQDLRTYVEAVKASHIGNLVWSIYCPRYHDL
ncbi:hypothetical protein AOCH_006566 [Aspergillus ochraceoroseus]|uniref:Fusicoccadiene synthase n=2 Tax=Aspergillus subgen. Nidulantes TaxID=2720870 RepID=A0A0F8V9Z2_9EURO|nr:hypothetical protein AOCH_006566 [Aspergillus ochraceoroseus]